MSLSFGLLAARPGWDANTVLAYLQAPTILSPSNWLGAGVVKCSHLSSTWSSMHWNTSKQGVPGSRSPEAARSFLKTAKKQK